jgi:hypothetical protein
MNLLEQFIVAAAAAFLVNGTEAQVVPGTYAEAKQAAMQVMVDATTLPRKPECQCRETGRFVILRGVMQENFWDTFFTGTAPGMDPTTLDNGQVAYRILGYADTISEAQRFIYGRSYS